jgi:hypothetical protein
MKKKPSKIDILAFIACVIIAIGYFLTSVFFSDSHICTKCKTVIRSNEDCVICDGKYYYHVECYQEKSKEDGNNETD